MTEMACLRSSIRCFLDHLRLRMLHGSSRGLCVHAGGLLRPCRLRVARIMAKPRWLAPLACLAAVVASGLGFVSPVRPRSTVGSLSLPELGRRRASICRVNDSKMPFRSVQMTCKSHLRNHRKQQKCGVLSRNGQFHASKALRCRPLTRNAVMS